MERFFEVLSDAELADVVGGADFSGGIGIPKIGTGTGGCGCGGNHG